MGAATFAVGLMPTYEQVGLLGPVLLVSLRLLQGLALGGEYGGAATYVAEHARTTAAAIRTSWIQTTATIGFFLVAGRHRPLPAVTTGESFKSGAWTAGWRIPFLVSLILLAFSVYIRLRLNESPVFRADEG